MFDTFSGLFPLVIHPCAHILPVYFLLLLFSPCLFWKVYRVLPPFFAFKNKLFIALCLMGDARQMAVFTGGVILLLCLHAQWEQMLHNLKNLFYKIARYQYCWFLGLFIYVLHVKSYVCICMWDVCVSWSPIPDFFFPVRSKHKVYRFCDSISWQACAEQSWDPTWES